MACHRTAPQSPSRRSGMTQKEDTTVLSLMEINQRMVEQADAEILAVIDSLQTNDDVQFAQMDCGAWRMRRDAQTHGEAQYGETPKTTEHWRVAMRVYTLGGKLLQDIEGVYAIKHNDLPIAVEEAVEDMVEGEAAIVYAPWYTAYGMKGTNSVKPYTNVRFDVTLKGKE